jgi:glyceraldehyde-3-phosphate dehydrogenase (NADP+)
MTELSNIPLTWQPQGGAFLQGNWRATHTAFDVTDPEDGALLARVNDTNAHDVDLAVTGLVEAFERGDLWPLWQRREALHLAAELVIAQRDVLVRIIYRESSKTISEATREVGRAAETLRLTAEYADRLTGETLPLANTPRGSGRVGWFTREPVGVVAAITPFNDPLNLVAHKVAPALLSGNVVAIKPAEATPLTALAFAEILLEAGVPAERFAVLPGVGPHAGQALAGDPRIDLLSFTGGHRTGDLVARQAGAKKTLMELGGNCAVLVLDDADWHAAAAAIVDGAFGCAGQNCVSVQRVFVAAELAEAVTDEIVRIANQLQVGTKSSTTTNVGPLINETEARRIEAWVEEARLDGARALTGGHRAGTFYYPTVMTGVLPTAKLMREEVFGPVVTLTTFHTLDDAVRLANDTQYGLQAGVFTRDIDAALTVTEHLRVGGVLINDTSDFRIDAMPFGGPKNSGVGREGVKYTIDAMTEPKVVIVNRRAQVPGEASHRV